MKLNRLFVSNRLLFTKLFVLITGVYIGLTISNWIRGTYEQGDIKPCVMVGRAKISPKDILYGRPQKMSQELDTKKLLFVGIMTAEKFLHSRASVVYNTWEKTVPGKVVFFAGNKSGDSTHSLPVVTLSGVDDSYPPQRKSLKMLKYMHDNFIDRFEWFMRCDDDVYIRTDKLEHFLRGFDSSEELFIGQAGQGLPSERGQLGLGPTDNFCMGGPGVVMSRSVLRKLAPHLEYCLSNLVSSHEDVEVGRCVKKHVGVSCTWAFEMQWIFYHNQSKTNAFHWDLDTKAVQNSITLHPIKTSSYMYRIHAHFLAQKFLAVQHISGTKSNDLQNLRKLKQPVTLSRNEVMNLRSKKDLHRNVLLNATSHWELFSPKTLYSVQSSPTQPVKYSIKRNMNLVLRRILAKINLEARKVIYRELLLSRVNLGYIRLTPTKGLQYIFDFRMVMYQYIGFDRRKLPINVQYQAHVQQSFGNLVYTSQTMKTSELPLVNIILPLSGRLEAFKRFLANFERIVLMSKEKVRLLIMYFPSVQSAKEHKNILENYRRKYRNFDVLWKTVEGRFSRGLALHLGVAQFNPDSLLFFCDVDLAFDAEFLHRCRMNTVKGRRVYFPMVFSEFNQTISLTKSRGESLGYKKKQSTNENLRSEHGFWRSYGYGIVCVYGEDVTNVGGFDLTINGWGLEDVRLYEEFLAFGKYDVIRAPDPGVVHVYHVAYCSPDLETSQLQSCKKSALSQLAHAGSLVDYMSNKGYL